MFGSGKFRDHTYLHSVAREHAGGRGSAGRCSVNSSSPTISGCSYLASDTIPEDSSQTDLETSAHDFDTTPLASGVEFSASELEQGIRMTFQPGHIRRAPLALEEVICEIEEKAGSDGDGDGDSDDNFLIPRSSAPERAFGLKGRLVGGCAVGACFLPISTLLHAQVDKPRPVPSSKPAVYEIMKPERPSRQLSQCRWMPRSSVPVPSPYSRVAPKLRPSPAARLYPRYAETHDTPRNDFRSR